MQQVEERTQPAPIVLRALIWEAQVYGERITSTNPDQAVETAKEVRLWHEDRDAYWRGGPVADENVIRPAPRETK